MVEVGRPESLVDLQRGGSSAEGRGGETRQDEKWREENPEWEKNWQAGTMSAVREIGDYQNKLPQGFKDRLNNVKKHHPYAKFDALK